VARFHLGNGASLDRLNWPGDLSDRGIKQVERLPGFERDLDRIKHSRPWRRLAGKCQVFIAPEDDHLRTRLTHAVEVAQVATGIARAANLCLPLVEAIALAHDCGHGPAGHASASGCSDVTEGLRAYSAATRPIAAAISFRASSGAC